MARPRRSPRKRACCVSARVTPSTRRAVVLFAKNPVSAAVKTRLVPPLSHVEAAELAAAFLADSSAGIVAVAAILRAKPCLFYDPPSAGDAIRRLVPVTLAMYPQIGYDLARRLTDAYDTLAREGISDVCFIGADSPTLPHAYVLAAFEALDSGSEIAIGPASDGGYYLIALRSAYPHLFERIDWSTSRVFAQTCERAAESGVTMRTLPEWYDVDDAIGLARLRAELLNPQAPLAHGEPAPRTKAFLASRLASDRMP